MEMVWATTDAVHDHDLRVARYYSSLYPTRKPADFTRYCNAMRANLEEPGRMEALLRMMTASKVASEYRLPRVTAPTLVLMGSRDPDFKDPEAEARWVAGSLRGTYQVVNDAGHYPHAEMPEFTGPLVLSFLQTLKEAKIDQRRTDMDWILVTTLSDRTIRSSGPATRPDCPDPKS